MWACGEVGVSTLRANKAPVPHLGGTILGLSGETKHRSLAHWSWRQEERGFVSVCVFPMVEEMKIKGLGENLSLCRINNSSYHLLSTYYELDSEQACYMVVSPNYNPHSHSIR